MTSRKWKALIQKNKKIRGYLLANKKQKEKSEKGSVEKKQVKKSVQGKKNATR